MNPVEYSSAQSKFKNIQDKLLPFLYNLKPIINESSDPFLIELVDEMDKFLETEEED